MFTTDLILVADLTGDDQWILFQDLKWETETETYVVPKNFRTDLASIPMGLRWAMKQNGRSRRPSVLHDFVYRNGLLCRKACDQLFLTALAADGMIAAARWIYYAGVRVGGIFAYKPKKDCDHETQAIAARPPVEHRLVGLCELAGSRKRRSVGTIHHPGDGALHRTGERPGGSSGES